MVPKQIKIVLLLVGFVLLLQHSTGVFADHGPSHNIGGDGVTGLTDEERDATTGFTDAERAEFTKAEDDAKAALAKDPDNKDLKEDLKAATRSKEEAEEAERVGITGAEAALYTASSPSECSTTIETIDGKETAFTPVNCLYLEEPIGGEAGYDLFIVQCSDGKCETTLWGGGSVPPNARGPIQAVLTFEPDKPYQGPFGLLYSYLGLIYGYMSGLIVGIAVLFVVIGGVQMITSAGNPEAFGKGKNRIVKAIVGMILWFTASLILYTINPTFFAF